MLMSDATDTFEVSPATLGQEIAQLAHSASIEINVADAKYLDESRAFLPEGARIFVSHLPRQQWEQTLETCEQVRRAGFEPVPHLPVRLLGSQEVLADILGKLRKRANAVELLLISGDYPQASGPYDAVAQVLATGLLERSGFTRVCLAGHPEGHPKVALDHIRAAERDKVALAARHGLDARLVTQFLFEPAPFLEWVDDHRDRGLQTRFVCGLAGPAKISTLMRYALRCGVGPSIRALGTHTSALKNLLADHGPDRIMRQLATARTEDRLRFEGLHLFCFGGFIRTCRWLKTVASGNFRLNDIGGFDT